MPDQSSIPTLTVDQLSCRYEMRQDFALQDISFSAYQGQIVLIAGASGSGKTTLLRCINGLIPRSYKAELSGRILFNNQDFSGKTLKEISRVVGTVLQDPERQILGAFVRNEVAFGLENLAVPRAEMHDRIDRILDYLGIAHLKDRETFSLSGGEKQKIALAGVLVMEPQILTLDEPLANLDPASAREALRLIRRLADEGKTVLIIEHRVEDVLSLEPDHVLYLEGGRAIYQGSDQGLQETADYRSVKLPAPVVLSRAKGADQPQIPAPPPADPGAPVLVAYQQVSFHYPGGPPVLQDINLSIRQGDIIAVLGPNGAGKTTLVKHAIGLLRPTEGKLLLGGDESAKMTVANMAGTVGYVFQSPRHMLFAPSVAEELAFGPRNLGFSANEIAANTEQALAVVNLSGEAERSPLSLSFGQQKRVTIASVLGMRSQILVMDEPTAGQDYANYMNFMDSVVGLRAGVDQPYRFSAILFITHDVDLAVCYANRVLLMSEGRIVRDGPPQTVLSDFELMENSRVIPTSLLRANLEHFPQTGRFLRAEALAQAVN